MADSVMKLVINDSKHITLLSVQVLRICKVHVLETPQKTMTRWFY